MVVSRGMAGIVAVVLGPATAVSQPRLLSGQPSGYQAEVHQATGMISAQLDVTQAEALIRMRAHAFSQRRAVRMRLPTSWQGG